jgi:two-component system, response regulator
VEDEEAHAEIVRRNFEISRIANRLMHVADGQAALDYLYQRNEFSDPARSPRPGVILLDLRLPKVDGLEVLKIIKADEDLKTIPVVVLTSSRETPDLVEFYKYGANAYVVKPVDFSEFMTAVKEIGVFWAAINEPPVKGK